MAPPCAPLSAFVSPTPPTTHTHHTTPNPHRTAFASPIEPPRRNTHRHIFPKKKKRTQDKTIKKKKKKKENKTAGARAACARQPLVAFGVAAWHESYPTFVRLLAFSFFFTIARPYPIRSFASTALPSLPRVRAGPFGRVWLARPFLLSSLSLSLASGCVRERFGSVASTSNLRSSPKDLC